MHLLFVDKKFFKLGGSFSGSLSLTKRVNFLYLFDNFFFLYLRLSTKRYFVIFCSKLLLSNILTIVNQVIIVDQSHILVLIVGHCMLKWVKISVDSWSKNTCPFATELLSQFYFIFQSIHCNWGLSKLCFHGFDDVVFEHFVDLFGLAEAGETFIGCLLFLVSLAIKICFLWSDCFWDFRLRLLCLH